MYIAVDIGGTNIRVAGSLGLEKVSFEGEPIRIRNTNDYDADIRFIVEAAREIARKNITAVGVSMVGTINNDKTGLVSAKNLSHWNGKLFVVELSRALGCPVYMECDTVAGALAETYYGGTKGDFAYVIWGTGIGGALVRDDNHTVYDLDWEKYFSRWEDDCGGRELELSYGKPPEQFTGDIWSVVLDKFTEHSEEFIDTLHPKGFVFGGGLSVRHADDLKKLGSRLGIPFNVTSLGGDGGLYGAFALVSNQTNHKYDVVA